MKILPVSEVSRELAAVNIPAHHELRQIDTSRPEW
jgi:hypothetical protein